MSFIAELKRRNVVKVGIAYVVASWLLLQLTEVLTELLELDTDVGKIVIILLVVGFIPALIFAWAFELTPEGIKREAEVDRSQSIAPRTGRKLDFVIIGMLVLIAGYFIWEARFKEGAATTAIADTTDQVVTTEALIEPSPAVEMSIVVLPFVNMSNDPDQEFFSDGLSEEILNALVKSSDLRVISRTSAFAFKGKDLSIPQIAEQLAVSHVLEGSVRTAGNNVRITAQLIEVATDSHLWSEAYSRQLENVFEIQEEISLAIADALHVELSDTQGAERPTESLAAYEAFLRGRHLYQRRENFDIAVSYLENAVELDPNYADAWANLAATLMVQAFSTEEGFEELVARSRSAVEQAIQIDPQHGFAHAVLGLHLFGSFEFEEANEALQTALRLNPNESNSYLWRAILLSALGYVDEAIDLLERAERIDPLFINLHNWLTTVYLMKGDFAAARNHRDVATELNPAWAFNNIGALELIDGDIDEAERLNLAEYQESPSAQRLTRAYYAAIRDRSLTDEFVALNREIDPNRDDDIQGAGFWDSTSLLYSLGEVDEALDGLRRYRALGRGLRVSNGIGMTWYAATRAHLSHPSLPAFFEEFGLVDYWRKHGDPDYCRVSGDTVECDTQ